MAEPEILSTVADDAAGAGRRPSLGDRLLRLARMPRPSSASRWGHRWPPDPLRNLSLRVRLVAILVALALVALTITGALAVTLLREQLIDKVDAQVRAVTRTVVNGGQLPSPPSEQQPNRRGRLPTTLYGVVFFDSGVVGTFGDRMPSASQPALSGLMDPAVAQKHDRQCMTVPSQSGSGRWRVVARRVFYPGEGAGTLVVGQSLEDVDDTVAQMTVVLLLVGLGVLVAVGILGGLVVRRELRPLTEVEAVAEGIAGGDLSRRVPDHPPTTEVGRLSASLNAMLSQIEQSFAVRAASQERMRRFVSDASHELRTPLAAVRGYAELYRQGAVREPEHVAGAMRRIEDEATRMGGLVEDLLTLARLDEQRRDRRSPVDLTVLAADAVQDARALDAAREVRLVPLGGALGPVVVDGDEPRLRQVVTNLVANALRHTPSGAPVELAIGRTDGHGLLEVRDHGPGIAREQADKVFERFFRADASRQRGRGGGSGLGLAIVAAIVTAHGGRVGLSPTPGGGATFVVDLPLRAEGARDDADVDDADDADGAVDVHDSADLQGSADVHEVQARDEARDVATRRNAGAS
jgi:two-component system, OmpR family, sensor kinase